MRQFTSLQVAILALGSLCFSSVYAGSTLVPMSDAELSATRTSLDEYVLYCA